MTTTSPEFLTLEAIRDWMATLTIWQQWTGLSGDALKARVVWPLKNAPDLPVAVLGLRGSKTVNKTGAAGGSNFDPSGRIALWVYAADTGGDDEQKGYSDFGDMFFQLKSEMADKAHDAPVLFNSFEVPETPIVRSSWVTAPDEDEGLSAWWQGEMTISWGVET